MRWLLRLFLHLFVYPVIALLVLMLLAFHFVPQTKLRSLAAEEIGRRIHRQVELGRIHPGLRGLVIDDLRLSDIPDFNAGTLVSAKGVRLGWDLRSLWEGLNVRKKVVTRSRGSFHIDEFHNPHYSARDFSLTWSLSGIDPSWTHLSGWARLSQGPGLLENIDRLMATDPSAKLALMPVTTLMNLERTGFVNFGLPDLRHWPLQSIEGDYAFDNGFMHIQRFTLASARLEMETSGVVELSSGKLSLDVELKSPPTTVLGALEIKTHVTGTVSHPQADLESLKKKAFRATIMNLLRNPEAGRQDVGDVLKKLFRQ
jgi:hypothetical protein